MNDNRFYNPWDVPNQSTSQIQQPARIGDCIGFTNSPENRNYYDPYSNYRDYYGYSTYDPYEIRRRREEEERRQRESTLNQIRFQDQLDRSYYAYLGVKFQRDTPEERIAQAEQEYQFIREFAQMKQEHEQFQFQSDFHIVGDYPEETVYQPPKEHVDVQEWINNMGYEYACILQKEAIARSRNLNDAYSSENYQRMLQNFNTNSTIDALTRDFTIDDMEIKLPDKLSREYQERRRKFMEALLT